MYFRLSGETLISCNVRHHPTLVLYESERWTPGQGSGQRLPGLMTWLTFFVTHCSKPKDDESATKSEFQGVIMVKYKTGKRLTDQNCPNLRRCFRFCLFTSGQTGFSSLAPCKLHDKLHKVYCFYTGNPQRL